MSEGKLAEKFSVATIKDVLQRVLSDSGETETSEATEATKKQNLIPPKKKWVKGEWSAMGHQFGEDLKCRCHRSYMAHQHDPRWCPNMEKIHSNQRCYYERDHKPDEATE